MEATAASAHRLTGRWRTCCWCCSISQSWLGIARIAATSLDCLGFLGGCDLSESCARAGGGTGRGGDRPGELTITKRD